MIARGNALTAVIVINGRVAGTWKKALKKRSIEIIVNPFRLLDDDEQEAVESEVSRFGRFFGIPAVLAENHEAGDRLPAHREGDA